MKIWDYDEISNLAKSYQSVCLLFAAADLNLFSALKQQATARSLTEMLHADLRAITILLDALVAMELLVKKNNHYSVPPVAAKLLSDDSPDNILPIVRHQANCLRRWVQLPQIVKSGLPAQYTPSINGEAADLASFIGAMDNISIRLTSQVMKKLDSLSFHNLLDIGGALGTWTIAFLNTFKNTSAIIFDLPDVIPMAKKHIKEAGLFDRVEFVKGDFYKDDLPVSSDFAWLSAIAHQNSREQNRRLFAKIHSCLLAGGFLVLRDVVMDESRTSPPAGAFFAVNMLTATQEGSTYTFEEYRSDLSKAGFKDITLMYRDKFMCSLILAKK